MAAIDIFTTDQKTKFSKPFVVGPGMVAVISSFNFGCEQTNEIGEVTKKGDCAVLHKLEIESDVIPQMQGCVGCGNCVLNGLETKVTNSEPVVQCGQLWTHNSNNNLSVLSVPGYYMFELCDESSVGNISMQVEELSVNQATLLPKSLFHGE